MVNSVSSLTSLYGPNGNSRIQGLSQVFDVTSTMKNTQAMLSTFKENNGKIQTLQKDSSQFLNQYTSSMNQLNKDAGKLTGYNLNNTLNGPGWQTDKTSIKNTVNSMQNLVDSYNKGLKTLSDNKDRGVGVTSQLSSFQNSTGSKENMDLLGISKNEDGTLSLNQTKLTESLTAASESTNPGIMSRLKEAFAGENGVASDIQKASQKALQEPAGNLISNDLASMREIQQDDPLRNFASEMRSGSAYVMNNMAAGLMMNMLA